MNSTSPSTILGIDPGTQEMGLAVIRGPRLVAYGVFKLRNGHRPYDLIGHARNIVFDWIDRHNPQVLAIEEPLQIPTRRANILNVIAEELRRRGEELGLKVVELSPRLIRERVMGNPHATKVAVAEHLALKSFPQLHSLIPRAPARSGLALRPKDKYWLHMFDALAIALAFHLESNST